MSRKTVSVIMLLEYANKNLKRDDEYATVDFKSGVCTMIEMVLMDTGNYAGFMFQDNDDSDTGTLGYFTRSYFYSPKMRKERLNAVKRSTQ
jgi:hypothetical protein